MDVALTGSHKKHLAAFMRMPVTPGTWFEETVENYDCWTTIKHQVLVHDTSECALSTAAVTVSSSSTDFHARVCYPSRLRSLESFFISLLRGLQQSARDRLVFVA